MMATRVVGDLLREQARAMPDKPYLWCGDDRLTFAETDERSDRVAAGLAELGVGPGDRVAAIASNRTEMLEAFFACAKLGAVQVPTNVFLKGEFLRYQLDDSQASTLLLDGPGFHAWAQGMVMGALVHGLTAVIEPTFSASTLLDRFVETGVSVFSGVGAMGMALLATPPSDQDRAHRLRVALMIPFPGKQQEA